LVVSSSLSTRAIKKDKMKIGAYIKDSFDELLNKVTWPTWEELQSSAVVVAIASLIIALIIFAMDQVFSNLMELFYDLF
jgi:preprotein translocase subunit SecE